MSFLGRLRGQRERGAHQLPWGARATVVRGRVDELRGLLERIGSDVDGAASFPFSRMGGVHFARLVLLDDSQADGESPIPASLVIMSEIDAPLERHLEDLGRLGGPALDASFGLCEDYPADPTPQARIAYLRQRQITPEAAYVNTVGRPLEQIRREAALRDRIEDFLDEHRDDLPAHNEGVRAEIQRFVRGDPSLRWAMRRAPRPSLRWRARETVHAVTVAAALALAAPLVLLLLPFYVIILRLHERRDPAPHIRPSPEHAERLSALEDFGAQNQFSAIGYVKPGSFRRLTIRIVLWLIDYSARHVFVRGSLAGVKTIHFARWTSLDDFRRVIFTSNYDGSLEAYNDDFIDKVAFGLNAAFSNGVGYPRTKYLFFEGARREHEFKDYLRRHQIPTQVFYSAYDQLSAVNIENNALIRSGLPGKLAPAETDAWLRLL
ncbi:MAG: hypothetical protein M3N47_04515 [Chloroflexota bacterium]|nr:hypothetical protein [Chloroflexota bacterium]